MKRAETRRHLPFISGLIAAIAVGAMLFTINPRLAVYILIPTPLVVGGSIFFWRRVYPNYYRYWDSSSKQAGTLSGMLLGIRVVKAFAQENREFNRFNRSSDYLRRSRETVEKATASFTSIMALIFSLGGLIVWYTGGREVLAGKMNRHSALRAKSRPLLTPEERDDVRQTVAFVLCATGALERGTLTFGDCNRQKS